ncbi:hypothetical protein DB35_13155 [Streptomyces abyssalis]|uniref:DNA primase/polymerase bifunctional N-terminal domain-containing protein n=1 Tax=Streptomyces abyssalis TaxID=933944 RepID=A0A1E7JIR6_9ACTN|nr:bifunctional DNA primase/polymerase [Streptomyces abyssalis]OEU86340.1 hypothetical protein AN215_24825 [Streptomyces abyssalis]OEU93309.1 hypothetical protein DB35_13155 [Streptomyces abyssalis]
MMSKRGIQWLSASADDPEACREHWAADPRAPYPLSAGRYFDVVSVAQRVGLETFEQLTRHNMPMGPVVMDRSARRTGFFLPSGQRERFARMVLNETTDALSYRYLDEGSVIVAPGPMPLSADRYAWLRAPTRRPEATPARVAALAAMLVATSALVDRAEQYERERVDLEATLREPQGQLDALLPEVAHER